MQHSQDPGHVKHDEPRSDGKTGRSKEGSFTKRKNRKFLGHKGRTFVDDNIPVPVIKAYSVSTAEYPAISIEFQGWNNSICG